MRVHPASPFVDLGARLPIPVSVSSALVLAASHSTQSAPPFAGRGVRRCHVRRIGLRSRSAVPLTAPTVPVPLHSRYRRPTASRHRPARLRYRWLSVHRSSARWSSAHRSSARRSSASRFVQQSRRLRGPGIASRFRCLAGVRLRRLDGRFDVVAASPGSSSDERLSPIHSFRGPRFRDWVGHRYIERAATEVTRR